MPLPLYLNNWSSTLTAGIDNAVTAIPIIEADADLLDMANTTYGYYLTLDDFDGNIEIVFCYTNVGSPNISCNRGQLGTSAKAWLTGTKIEQRVPAQMLDGLRTNPLLTRNLVASADNPVTIFATNEFHVTEIELDANITSLGIANPGLWGSNPTWRHTVILQQDATGSRTVAWGSTIKWPGGTPPVMSTAANAVDIYDLYFCDAHTFWYGVITAQNIPG